jgi:hypothetical protein
MNDVVAYGYRYGEVKLAALPAVKSSLKLSEPRINAPLERPVVQASLGCHVVGAALPHCDPSDPVTMQAGVRKRFGCETPQPKSDKLKRLRLFVQRFCREKLKPISVNADRSVEAWLAKTKYPNARKDELLRKHTKILRLSEKHFRCKSFMKDETYSEFKHARGINSRSDEFKTKVGPIFRLMEEEVYKLKQFIKHVPVKDRAQYIKDMLFRVGAVYFESDYTTFEALFRYEIMDAVEFELYDYMTSNLPEHDEFMVLIRRVLGGTNHCDFKQFWVELEATRMSGEMCTSLGNGFTNLLLMLFICSELGSETEGVVEGDDGLFRIDGPIPTSEDFAELGFVIKLQVHDDLCSASFCGIIFDSDECINVTNPAEVLCTFGWTTNRYAKSSRRKKMDLLRCKALSYAWQYPGCPIIQSLAQYGLRMTKKTNSAHFRNFVEQKWMASMWEREQILTHLYDNSVPIKEVGMQTRLLVERKFNISVESQLMIEKYLDELDELVPLTVPLIDLIANKDWINYWNVYVHPAASIGYVIPFVPYDGFVAEWQVGQVTA